MSFARRVYYSAVLGGWAALMGWLPAQWLVLRDWPPAAIAASGSFDPSAITRQSIGPLQVAGTAALVGTAIAIALNLVANLTNPTWHYLARRLPAIALWSALTGAAGGLIGTLAHSLLGLPRAIGWLVMGIAIGTAEGLCESSTTKVRNGLLGGAVGGLLGGLLFDLVTLLLGTGSILAARATSFVVLGLCVGVMVGLSQVVFREAWLTVVEGFRPGRQLVLTQPVTVLGRSDNLPLPLLGHAGRELEQQHAQITHTPEGQYLLEDLRSRSGTRLNGQMLRSPALLKDGDLIRLGSNILRFNFRGPPKAQSAQEPSGAMVGGKSTALESPTSPWSDPAPAGPTRQSRGNPSTGPILLSPQPPPPPPPPPPLPPAAH
jgi:hypothetical protein